MKITKVVLIIAFLSLTNFCFSQEYKKNVAEFNFDFGISKDFGTKSTFNAFSFPEHIQIEKSSIARAINFNLSFTRYLNNNHGIKLLFGRTKFGFDFEGAVEVTGRKVIGYQRTKYLEFGISYIRRIPLTSSTKLLLAPGIRYHSDGSPHSNAINFIRNDSFAFSSYSGIEFPMHGEDFFANIGLQVKLPLQRYNNVFDGPEGYYPYFIGVKVGVNYQF